MSYEYYRRIIAEQPYKEIGRALGQAIKDEDIKPDVFGVLCRLALDKGFSFRYIVFF